MAVSFAICMLYRNGKSTIFGLQVPLNPIEKMVPLPTTAAHAALSDFVENPRDQHEDSICTL